MRAAAIAAIVALAIASPAFAGGRSQAASTPDGETGRVDGALVSIGVRPVDAAIPLVDHRFELLSGAESSLADYRGRLVLVNVWATWCEPCKLEMPSMERLHRAFADRGLVVLALNYAERRDLVSRYIESEAYTFPVALDPARALSDAFGVRGLPTNYLIGPHGRVIGTKVGFRFWDTPEVFDAFEVLLEAEWTPRQSD